MEEILPVQKNIMSFFNTSLRCLKFNIELSSQFPMQFQKLLYIIAFEIIKSCELTFSAYEFWGKHFKFSDMRKKSDLSWVTAAFNGSFSALIKKILNEYT